MTYADCVMRSLAVAGPTPDPYRFWSAILSCWELTR